jgi:hypothetical protein
MNHERIRIRENPKLRAVCRHARISSFELCHSFVISHSSFVISHLYEIVDPCCGAIEFGCFCCRRKETGEDANEFS